METDRLAGMQTTTGCSAIATLCGAGKIELLITAIVVAMAASRPAYLSSLYLFFFLLFWPFPTSFSFTPFPRRCILRYLRLRLLPMHLLSIISAISCVFTSSEKLVTCYNSLILAFISHHLSGWTVSLSLLDSLHWLAFWVNLYSLGFSPSR